MILHRSITWERVELAIQDSITDCANPGFCLACGDDADGCEPDARNYKCMACGQLEVFGAEEVALML